MTGTTTGTTTSTTRTALILGAGRVGAEVARLLDERGGWDRLVIADRDHAAARRAAEPIGATALELDAKDDAGCRAAFRDASIVLNAAGGYGAHGARVIEAAIEVGVPCADVGDELEPFREIFGDDRLDRAARDAAVPIVVGLGTSPGLTNILARHAADRLDQVHAIELALATGPWLRGAAVWAHRLHVNTGMATIFRKSRWIEVPARSEPEQISFPWAPGTATVHIVAHPEPLTLPRRFPELREVVMKLGYSDKVNALLGDLVAYGLTSTTPIEVAGVELSPAELVATHLASPEAERALGFGAMTPYSARQIRVTGISQQVPTRVTYQLAFVGGAAETALPLVIAAEQIRTGQVPPGVHAPESLDPAPFLSELRSRGVKARTIVERDEFP